MKWYGRTGRTADNVPDKALVTLHTNRTVRTPAQHSINILLLVLDSSFSMLRFRNTNIFKTLKCTVLVSTKS